MTEEDQHFSEKDDSEMKIPQKKCDSDTDDEMKSTDDLETVDRWNSEHDDNFSVHNNDDVMNESMESI